MNNEAVAADAASAVRRLAAALVGHEASTEALSAIAKDVNALAAEVEAGTAHDRELDYQRRWARFHDVVSGNAPDESELVADGAPVGLYPLSPIAGTEHPRGFDMSIHREGDAAVGVVRFDAAAEAAPRRVHGGLIAACVDEMFAAVLIVNETFAFTGSLSVRYVGPCPIEVPVEFRAHVAGRDGRKLDLRCVGTVDGAVIVEAQGTGISVDVDGLGW